MNIENKIIKEKNKLIKKAKEKGIYENFGQKEVRILKDKAFELVHIQGYQGDYIFNLIQNFEYWCMNYTIR